ncbi:hypothetical protein [Rhizobium sophoriradicis]|nr:hypothetical protein [Rhizobium sophoriradicis]
MTETRDLRKASNRPTTPLLSNGQKSFDLREEEFRRSQKNDKAIDF